MKLSYIIPVYNVEKYLRQCVDSVLAQSIDDYEIILVDDGSPDNCPSICDEYKEKFPDIVKVIHKENGGLPAARNAGFEIAQGEYVYFLDSDDFLFDGMVSEVYEKAKKYNADIIQFSYKSYDEKKDAEYDRHTVFDDSKIYSHCDIEDMINNHMDDNILIYVWRNLYRTEFLRENGIISDEKLKTMQDTPFNMEAFLKARTLVSLDKQVYCYRLREGSIQRRKFIKDYEEYFFYQWKVKLEKYEQNCTPSQKFYRDVAERNIKTFFPRMVRNHYLNRTADRFSALRKIGNSEMMRRSFKDYNIRGFKSKSMDWWLIWCVKHRLYLAAHIICDRVLYKKSEIYIR